MYVSITNLTFRPEIAVIGLAVAAVLGILNACSIVCDIADCVAGLTTPVTGLPLKKNYIFITVNTVAFSYLFSVYYT